MPRTKSPSLAVQIQKQLGLTRSRSFLFASGKRDPTLPMAIQIYQATGAKLGPIKSATDEEVQALKGIVEREAA